MYKSNSNIGEEILPVDIVLAPEWWNKNAKITFDKDFFFHPLKRVEEEQHMEQILYERWGQYGLGQHKDKKRPEIGAVHLAAGFIVSEMLGCKVEYSDGHPPQVIAANQDKPEVNLELVFSSEIFSRTEGGVGLGPATGGVQKPLLKNLF